MYTCPNCRPVKYVACLWLCPRQSAVYSVALTKLSSQFHCHVTWRCLSTISLTRILENDGCSFHWSKSRDGGGSSSTVTLQRGDTLRVIDFREIARENSIQNEDLIYPGQMLKLSGGGKWWDSGR